MKFNFELKSILSILLLSVTVIGGCENMEQREFKNVDLLGGTSKHYYYSEVGVLIEEHLLIDDLAYYTKKWYENGVLMSECYVLKVDTTYSIDSVTADLIETIVLSKNCVSYNEVGEVISENIFRLNNDTTIFY